MVQIYAKVEYLNLGGIGLVTSSKLKSKLYNLKLNTVLNGKDAELNLKIKIIKVEKQGNDYVYRAVYRYLTTAQTITLQAVAESCKKGVTITAYIE